MPQQRSSAPRSEEDRQSAANDGNRASTGRFIVETDQTCASSGEYGINPLNRASCLPMTLDPRTGMLIHIKDIERYRRSNNI
jgi:hypothetical protein